MRRMFPRQIIIIIKRKDLGGVMSKDTVQTSKTVTKRDCDTIKGANRVE